MSRIRSLAIILFLFTITGAVFAQDDDPIRIDSAVVKLNVGVVDAAGKPITDLSRANFSVYEDGVEQEITAFEAVSAPFSVVILLDMSGSTLGFRQVIQQSAYRFVDALQPQDRIAVIEFSDKINTLNDFTSDRRPIANSIRVANGRGKTQLYKALDFALNKLEKENSRRKAVIVLTDGVDSAVREDDRDLLQNVPVEQMAERIDPAENKTLQRTLSRSDAQGVTIYPLALPTGDPAKLADPTPFQIALFKAARERLKIVADRSGGSLHTINRLEEMGKLYSIVAAEMQTLYTLEYQSTNDKRDGKWRAITIKTTNPDLISRTRQGYYAR
jgi:VWFA-related protein